MGHYDEDIDTYDEKMNRRIVGGEGTKYWSDYDYKVSLSSNIVSAEYTRQRQRDLADDIIKTQLIDIFNKINATTVSNYVYIRVKPHEKTKQKLIELGYKLEESACQRDGYIMTISW